MVESSNEQGFILTQAWRDRQGECVVTFGGLGEAGPFELQIVTRPVLFVDHGVALPPGLPVAEQRELSLTDFQGRQLDALYFATQEDLREARLAIRMQDLLTFESDILPADRYRMERFIHGAITFSGQGLAQGGVRCFMNPTVKAATWRPVLSTCSFDIETGQAGQLYSIAYDQCGRNAARHVHIVGEQPIDAEWISVHPDERSVLAAFLRDVERLDPDVLIGWNVVGFDLRFLERKCEELGMRLTLGRRGARMRITSRGSRHFSHTSGRIVIDGIQALRNAFYTFEDFSLETVASELLGRGKDINAKGSGKVAEIERRFREDKPALALYNLEDCRLVSEIFDHTSILEMMLTRTEVSGMLLDMLGRSVGAFEHIYLPRLHRAGLIAPDLDDIPQAQHAAGGLVFTPEPGIHDHVVVLDFKSLYPSVIRTFKIDPLSRLRHEINPIRTPVGTEFSATEHILPDYIAGMMELRAEAKRIGNAPLSQAIKILMNSFYGVMGSPGCRLYHYDLPSAITGTGQWLLRRTRELLETWSYRVLYGDTDSLFVCLQPHEVATPFEAARRLVAHVNRELTELLKREFEVDSVLDLEFEKYYRKCFLSPVRDDAATGAAKRYAGLLVSEAGEESLDLRGLEAVRSDYTALARRFQRELLGRAFHDEPIEPWLREVIQAIKRGECDAELVYTKRIRKRVEEYTSTVPPHIKAALLLPEEQRNDLRRIDYVIAAEGPVPASLPHGPLDYAHYISRQIKPIADAVLMVQGTSFDKLFDQQLSLFG